MMKTVMVRYRTRADQADANQRLIEAVFDELRLRQPAGLDYQALRLGDGQEFVHIASYDDAQPVPLRALAAFERFSAGIRERCEEPPATVELRRIGRYEG